MEEVSLLGGSWVGVQARMKILKMALRLESDNGREAVLAAYDQFLERVSAGLPPVDRVSADEQSVLDRFLADRCKAAPHGKVQSAKLYAEFRKWWSQSGNIGPAPSHRWFGAAMRKRFLCHDSNRIYYVGLVLSARDEQAAVEPCGPVLGEGE